MIAKGRKPDATPEVTPQRDAADLERQRDAAAHHLPVASSELPVVARVIVEVRSDGTRTIARGALEVEDETVSLAAEGTTPAELANALSRAVFSQLRELAATELLKWAPTLLGGDRTKRLLNRADNKT